MTATESVRPRPRAFWADARFLWGIVLIIASIAGVWGVVAAARHTVPVFAAGRTIVPGGVISAADLQIVDVALGPAGASYLAPESLEPGMVAVRTIGKGELVPRSAVGSEHDARTTTVVVRSSSELPAAVTTGSGVEVWAAAEIERGRFDTPEVLVSQATVLSVRRDSSMIGTSGTSIELVIDRDDVADTLAAVAGGASLSVVPLPGAPR